MAGRPTAQERARAAADGRDWQAAHDLLAGPAADPDAGADVLDTFAEALWWLGRVDECIEVRERAYAALETAGEGRWAARMAMLLSDNHLFRGRGAIARAWLQRARRLLEAEDECLQHGCLLLREGEAAHGGGDLDAAAARFEEAVAYGRRFGDADLEADGLQAMGRLLISGGRPEEGMPRLDDAMLLAVEGKLGPFMVGKVYCSLITACEQLGDLSRAAEWTDAGSRWADRHGFAVFPGLCRVHRAEILQLRGEWGEAEREARRACEELDDVHTGNVAAGFQEIGEIRRRLGDLDGADDAFARAQALGHDPQPGLALLRLAQGRAAAAAAGIGQALSGAARDPLRRAKLLPAQVEIAVAAGDVVTATDAAEELGRIADRFGTPLLRAAAATADGRARLGAGDPQGACASLREGLQRWQEADAPYEVGTTRLLMALASVMLGDDDGAAASFRAAREVFERLGAALDVVRLDGLRAGASGAGTSAAAGALPAGLTAREAEVLGLVASGATNKEVARRLGLSEKTVARHLSNIFVKTGVATRSAATAYAFEHGLAGGAQPLSR